jgi:hypothetical protein
MIHPFQFHPTDSQIFKIGKANSTFFYAIGQQQSHDAPVCFVFNFLITLPEQKTNEKLFLRIFCNNKLINRTKSIKSVIKEGTKCKSFLYKQLKNCKCLLKAI